MMGDLDDDAKATLATSIENFTTKYHVELGVREVLNTKVTILEVVANEAARRLSEQVLRSNSIQTTRSRLRRMQQDPSVTVTYDQKFTFKQTSFVVTTADGLATLPFEQTEFREEFVTILKNSGDFDDITGISEVSVGEDGSGPIPTPAPGGQASSTTAPTTNDGDDGSDDGDDSGLPVPAIIGIALGGAGILIVCCVIYLYSASRKDDNAYSSAGGGVEPPDNVKVGSKSDDVSQLPDPHRGDTGGDGLTYGDQRYVCPGCT